MRPERQASSGRMLVLGYGNTLRGDDGVGPRVAEAVAALDLPGVEALACPQLTPELAEPISRARLVVFVDAAVDGPRQVELRPVEPAAASQVMAHAAEPNTLLAMARDFYGYAPPAFCVAILVENIGIGEQLSRLAQSGVASAIEMITVLARSGSY